MAGLFAPSTKENKINLNLRQLYTKKSLFYNFFYENYKYRRKIESYNKVNEKKCTKKVRRWGRFFWK